MLRKINGHYRTDAPKPRKLPWMSRLQIPLRTSSVAGVLREFGYAKERAYSTLTNTHAPLL